MRIIPGGSVERVAPPKEAFGDQHAEAEQLVDERLGSQIRVLKVHFFNGTRNKLHTHTGDQILYCMSGKGQVGTETETFDVGPGDTIYFPPGEKHWHGAAPGEDFVHLAIHPVSKMVVFG